MASVFSVIEKRHSTRNYVRYTLKNAEIEKLKALFPHLPIIDNGVKMEWKIKTQTPIGSGKLFAVLYEQTPDKLVEYGFQGEALVLKLAEAGFGTCWMALGRATEKHTPAVIVFGKEATDSLYAKMSRTILRSDRRRDPEDLLSHESDKPTPDQETILSAMRLAPSAANRQPWRFACKGTRCIHVKRVDGNPAWSHLDLGIVLSHCYLAALALFGSAGAIRLDDDHYEIEF